VYGKEEKKKKGQKGEVGKILPKTTFVRSLKDNQKLGKNIPVRGKLEMK